MTSRPFRPGLLQRTWSYLFELPLDRASSELNPDLRVSLDRGEVKLTTPGVVYSFGLRYRSFAEVFRRLRLQERGIEEALVLGYGLGSIAKMLANLRPSANITGVEIDSVVIGLAMRYGYVGRARLIESDARSIDRYGDRTYDLICVDLFIEDQVPAAFRSPQFLTSLRSLLGSRGLLVYSTMDSGAAEPEEVQRSLEEVFSTVVVHRLGQNRMFVVDQRSEG